MTQQEKDERIQELREIIAASESKLRSKDYVGTKIAMGVATREDYADVIRQTEEWRTAINAAQEEMARVENLVPDEEEAIVTEE